MRIFEKWMAENTRQNAEGHVIDMRYGNKWASEWAAEAQAKQVRNKEFSARCRAAIRRIEEAEI